MKKPPAQTTTLINPTIITDSFESEHLCSSLEMIKTTPALRSAIPGPFVYSYKNLRKLPKGLLMSWPLDDDYRTYIHVSEHVSLTVRKVNYLGATRIEEIKYRASYSPVTNEFAVPIKRRIPLDLYRKLCQFCTKFTGERFVQRMLDQEPVHLKATMQIDALMEAQASADPTTMVPRKMIVEGAFEPYITTQHLAKFLDKETSQFGTIVAMGTASVVTGVICGAIIGGIIKAFNLGSSEPRMIKAFNV